MKLVAPMSSVALHGLAFVASSAALASAWPSPHALCLAAAITLFGGKLLRSAEFRSMRLLPAS